MLPVLLELYLSIPFAGEGRCAEVPEGRMMELVLALRSIACAPVVAETFISPDPRGVRPMLAFVSLPPTLIVALPGEPVTPDVIFM